MEKKPEENPPPRPEYVEFRAEEIEMTSQLEERESSPEAAEMYEKLLGGNPFAKKLFEQDPDLKKGMMAQLEGIIGTYRTKDWKPSVEQLLSQKEILASLQKTIQKLLHEAEAGREKEARRASEERIRRTRKTG